MKIQVKVNLSSVLQGEDTSVVSGAPISGSVMGSFQIVGLNQAVGGVLAQSTPVFNATKFDGTLDYAGTSGVTFPALTPTSYQMTTINAPLALVNFQTSGNSTALNPTVTINAGIVENSSGNTQYQATTQGAAVVSVTYDYLPNAAPVSVTSSAIPAGTYTIVPVATPGYADGKASSTAGKVAVEFGEQVIVVNLGERPVPRRTTSACSPSPSRQSPITTPRSSPGPSRTTTRPTASSLNGSLFTALDHHDW